jgi:hypothetical protein
MVARQQRVRRLRQEISKDRILSRSQLAIVNCFLLQCLAAGDADPLLLYLFFRFDWTILNYQSKSETGRTRRAEDEEGGEDVAAR